jgi:hypothetical protein
MSRSQIALMVPMINTCFPSETFVFMCAIIIFTVHYAKENIFCSVYGLYFTPLMKTIRGVIISIAMNT